MTEKIKEKLAELAAARENVLAQLHAISGAEQVLRELLGGVEDNADQN